MIRGIFVLQLLLVGCGLAACGGEKKAETSQKTVVKKSDIVKANTMTALLKKYKTITYSQLDVMNGEVAHFCYYKNSAGENAKTSIMPAYEEYGTEYFNLFSQKGKTQIILSAQTGKLQDFEHFFVSFGDDKKDNDTYEVVKQADGTQMITDRKTISKEYAKSLSASWGDVGEGDTLILRIMMKKDSYEITRLEYSILSKKNNMEKPMTTGVMKSYDKQQVVRSEKMNELQKKKQRQLCIHLKNGTKRVFRVPTNMKLTVECNKGEKLYEKLGKKKKWKTWSCPKRGLTGNKELYCK